MVCLSVAYEKSINRKVSMAHIDEISVKANMCKFDPNKNVSKHFHKKDIR